MQDYKEIAANEKVESVEFIGGGIARVTLKSNYGNRKFDGWNSRQQSVTAPFLATAVEFVEGAVASKYANNPGGGACRVADGTPLACNPHSETYWSM